MRCPKCGYISFDHLEKCLKCHKDIKAASNGLFGSTYNVQPPDYLRIHREKSEAAAGREDLFAENLSADDDFLDEELEILVDDDAAEAERQGGLADDEPAGGKLPDEEDEEDREIEIDFGQFEEGGEPEAGMLDQDEAEEEVRLAQENQPALAMEIPEELADISDLAPPGKKSTPAEQSAAAMAAADSAELSLDDFDLDLGLDELDKEQPKKSGIPKETILALDEIDFSEALAEGGSGTSKRAAGMDMDEDLDFDLDLGGLSIHKDLK